MIWLLAFAWPAAAALTWAAGNRFLGVWFAVLSAATWGYLIWSACEGRSRRLRERLPNEGL